MSRVDHRRYRIVAAGDSHVPSLEGLWIADATSKAAAVKRAGPA